ncbi:MAG TPA: presqualene diphosphate synthase HpnD [Alphaproteobacteria bacterium]|nr:presqualene diphosphate synthase HpnD [Alphaproteobacteria bacterium]
MAVIAYQDALLDVKARVAKSRSSFHAGMAILPKARRDAMYALYAFCREVDDIADDGATLEERTQGLQQWRERIALLFRNKQVSDSITAALQPAIESFQLVETDFQAIIDGMAMDAGDPICAPDHKMLDLYCDRVASAVGRASVRIFGDNSPTAMDLSYHLGRAFQLTNILRDIYEDAQRGRLYLPEELLKKHNVASRVPAEVVKDANLPAVCRELAVEAEQHFTLADKAMSACKPEAMKPAKIMRAYYGAIFEKLKRCDWKNISKRVTLPKWKKLWLVLRELFP